jgi:hypothetical protein
MHLHQVFNGYFGAMEICETPSPIQVYANGWRTFTKFKFLSRNT